MELGIINMKNQFKDCWTRWRDYFSIIINEFPILLIRKYDFLDVDVSVLIIQIFGFEVYTKRWLTK